MKLNARVGTTATPIGQFQPDRGYSGSELGVHRLLLSTSPPRPAWERIARFGGTQTFVTIP